MPVFIKGAAGAPKNEFGNKLLYGVGNIFTDESLVVTHVEGDEIWTGVGGYTSRACFDPDGNIVFTSQHIGGNLITKIDTDGNIIWTNNEIAYACDIDIDTDGNIYVTHLTTDTYNKIVSFRKLDKNGNEIWRKLLSDTSHYCYAVKCYDGGIYIGTGASIGYKSLIKYDSDGNEIWAITNRYTFNDIDTDHEGNVYATSPSSATYKTFCKYDKDGNEMFLLGRYDTARRIKCAKDGVYVAYNPNTTETFAKYAFDGTFIWKDIYSYIPNVKGIATDANNNVYIITQGTDSHFQTLRKFDKNGNSIWGSYQFSYGRDILLDKKGIAYCFIDLKGTISLTGTIKKIYLEKEYRLEREVL